ncbi:MAG: Asp-tRNA(Asn)/Glu-tRNA(Gln) amidotransferase subunit GatA [Chlamydiales bacterium]|nr:Asp-tRNA(Asn)/Glu-tRNA(Gln) amidotransferase subunit GatA [Chlamydiales bacterium]
MEFHHLSAQKIREHFLKGDLTAQQIAEKTLARIQKHDPGVGAFLRLLSERVLERAKRLDQKKEAGKPLGKLAGVPVAVKDNIHIRGELTTCASRFLDNYRAVFDATVSHLMEEEDALLIGKTNMDEFAMGSSTENSAFQLTKNPWDLKKVPGGSSGGSAAAVAARFCPLALGSDTGGSIRQPASFCGIVGFKPTYGRVSRYGLVAFASSLDQIGPLATNTSDAALLMEVIGKHCKRDSTSLNAPQENYLEKLGKRIQGTKIGVPQRFLEGLEQEAKASFLKALDIYKDLGASVVDIDLDILKHSVAVYYILATAEASTNLARFDGIRYGRRSTKATDLDEVYDFSKQEGFGPEVKNRILLGTYVLSSGYQDAYYKKAQKVRTLMIEQYDRAFSQCDVVAMPTSPFTAFELQAVQDPLQMYLQDIYTISANLAGLPSISIPSGFDAKGLPFGLQISGPQMEDARVLNFAHAFEKIHSPSTPPLFA